MSDPAPPPAPKPNAAPKRRRRWPIGCALATLLLCCCGPVGGIAGLTLWGWHIQVRDEQAFAEQFFREALAGGDWKLAYDRAAPDLRKAHDWDAFRVGLRL